MVLLHHRDAHLQTRPRLLPAPLAFARTLAVARPSPSRWPSPSRPRPAEEDRSSLTVFAAASLADALQPLGEQFEAEHNTDVRFSFGGSTTLAQQIVRDAPADVFVSAGRGPMDHVESAQLLASGSRADLLGNALVLVGPAEGVAIESPEGLLLEDVRRIAMADPALAPAGAYAQEALEGLGLWESLQPKLVYGPDVRTAMQYAASGSVDAAVVYATDAAGVEGVRVLWRFPEGSHKPVRYPSAALADADNPEGAARFLAFLRTEEAQAAFRAHGFTTP